MMIRLMVKDITLTAHLCDVIMGSGQVCVQVSFFKMFSSVTDRLIDCRADHSNHSSLALLSKRHLNKLANQNKDHYLIRIKNIIQSE